MLMTILYLQLPASDNTDVHILNRTEDLQYVLHSPHTRRIRPETENRQLGKNRLQMSN